MGCAYAFGFSSFHREDAQRERKLLENLKYFSSYGHTSSLQHTNLLATFSQENNLTELWLPFF
jgi:hypothetical protein